MRNYTMQQTCGGVNYTIKPCSRVRPFPSDCFGITFLTKQMCEYIIVLQLHSVMCSLENKQMIRRHSRPALILNNIAN